jgi:hypothetical protein
LEHGKARPWAAQLERPCGSEVAWCKRSCGAASHTITRQMRE